MTDAAIIALSTSSAGVTIAVVVVVFLLSRQLSSAKDERETYRVQATDFANALKASGLLVASLTNDLKTANGRVEALDAENAKLRSAQPVAGAFDRLLQDAAPKAADSGAGGNVVPHDKPAAPSGANALLDPNAP